MGQQNVDCNQFSSWTRRWGTVIEEVSTGMRQPGSLHVSSRFTSVESAFRSGVLYVQCGLCGRTGECSWRRTRLWLCHLRSLLAIPQGPDQGNRRECSTASIWAFRRAARRERERGLHPPRRAGSERRQSATGMADALPPLTPRSAAAQAQHGSGSPRRRKAQQTNYQSPRRAVRESIGAVATLPPPPKSFSAMYARRCDWTEVTGL